MHLLLAAAMVSGLAAAHDPDITTLALHPTDTGWVLDVHFPLEAAERGLGRPGDDGTWDDQDKARLVQHIRERVSLEADGHPLRLGVAGVKLGGHQSTVRLGVEGAPSAWSTLTASVPVFADNPHQHNVVRVQQADGTRDHLVAKASNGFRGVLGTPGTPAQPHAHAHGSGPGSHGSRPPAPAATVGADPAPPPSVSR